MRTAMAIRSCNLVLIGVGLVLFLLPSAAVYAQLDKDEQVCVNALNRNLQKVSSARGKALSSCLKDFAKGRNTNIAACIAMDPKGKITKAEAKALADQTQKCADPPNTLVTSAASNNQVAAEKVAALIEILFGSEDNGAALTEAAEKEASKCQQKAAKSLEKCQDTKLKAFNSCKKLALKGGGGIPEVEACVMALAESQKVAKICGKVKTDIEKKCVGKGVALELAFPHCDPVSSQSVADCLEIPLDCEVCQALNTADGLNVDCDSFDDNSPNGSCAFGDFLALSYNVAGLPDSLSDSIPSLYTPIISPLLNGYDLVLVQESWQTPDPNPLAPLRVYHELLIVDAHHPFQSVPQPLPVGTDPNRPSALVSDGLNRFSQFPFDPIVRTAWAECHGLLDHGADCLALKGFSVARTTLAAGVTVDIYNLHMEAGNDPNDSQIRDESVTQLAEFLNVFSVGQPVIVGGDFNLNSDTEPDLSQFQRLLDETGLTDVCAALGCPEPGRIDKFLFRSSPTLQISPTSWRFEIDLFVTDEGEPLSDHDALAVRFEWSLNP